MVRINLVEPKELTDQHLLAENVEILMLTSYILKFPKLKGNEPKEFTLNKGHMLFFKDKVLYLKNRYELIQEECKRRGFNVSYKFPELNKFPEELLNNWRPLIKNIYVVRRRINERILLRPEWYKYEGQKAYAYLK